MGVDKGSSLQKDERQNHECDPELQCFERLGD